VLKEGVLMAVIALVVGGVAAGFLSRFIESLLFGVEAGDPTTYAAVGILLGLGAAMAAYLPARRATKVDPMEALRSE
jgi:ABC-type antimicrobial peptide transport system permease subunit